MEKQGIYEVLQNTQIAKNIFRMALAGDTGNIQRPGQFVNIEIPGLYLRRPISVCDVADDHFTVIYKTVGQGTMEMSRMLPGQSLNILTGLGNGFNVNQCGGTTLLIGGGVGVPPLYLLAKVLLQAGKTPVAIMGFNAKEEVILEEEFQSLGVKTYIATMDGSYGQKGFVTDILKTGGVMGDYFCACGPLPMLKAVCNVCDFNGQASFEQRMGCGFGACMCCSVMTKKGPKRICKEGPVLLKEEILW
jgi:dihydroorotate dehydrogenase electron transfer subunit